MAFIINSVKKLLEFTPTNTTRQSVNASPELAMIPRDDLSETHFCHYESDDDVFEDAPAQCLKFDIPSGSTTPIHNDMKRVKRKEKDPSRFDGKSNWSDFKVHFDYVAEWNGWTESECGLQLAICLTGGAREVLSSLNKTDRLVEALNCRFYPEGRETQYMMELMARERKPDEDVTTYGHTLRRLASRAYVGTAVDEQMLISIFMRGLGSADIKRHVYLQKPETLNQVQLFRSSLWLLAM